MDDTKKKGQPGIYRAAINEAEKKSGAVATGTEDMVLFQYPDYETYRQVQEDGNKAKLTRQYVRQSHVERLAKYLKESVGEVTFGLCHGTRSGREQAWFKKHLGSGKVIGTEISSTASQFKNTVQWDFHDRNPDWVGKANFVYSNSWDHAFDPDKAFRAWIEQLKPGGVLLLDHTAGQMPKAANALDPFGVTLPKLRELLSDAAADISFDLGELDYSDNEKYSAIVVTLTKR